MKYTVSVNTNDLEAPERHINDRWSVLEKRSNGYTMHYFDDQKEANDFFLTGKRTYYK